MNKELKEKYDVSTKTSYGNKRIPRFQRWHNQEICDSLEEVSKKYLNHPQNALVREEGDSCKIYTFESLPSWGSHEGNKWEAYKEGTIPAHFVHVRVKPILTLEEGELEQEVNR